MKRQGEGSPKDEMAAQFQENDVVHVGHQQNVTKRSAARGVRRCFIGWMRCPNKSKGKHRRDRNQGKERKGINISPFHCTY